MKRLIITALCCAILGSVYAQKAVTDTIKVNTDTTAMVKKKGLRWQWGNKVDTTRRISKANAAAKITEDTKTRAAGFSFGLTFTNLHLGFATLIDNGSFTLSAQNNFLSYKQIKTSNVGFDLLKFGYRFTDNFKLSLAAGFDWTHIRLQQDIKLIDDQPTLTYEHTGVNYSKNRFSSNYVVLPLSFDYRTKEFHDGKRFHFVAGPEVGFLIDGMQKQKSDDFGKKKDFNNFHFTRFEYGGFARIAYGNFGIYTKYYFNDMFENSAPQKGLKSLDFGLVWGF